MIRYVTGFVLSMAALGTSAQTPPQHQHPNVTVVDGTKNPELMPALIQGSQTPDQIPDSAAWRIFLGAKGEAVSTAGHSESFTSYLAFLNGKLRPHDLAIFQAVLEDYGARSVSLRNSHNELAETATADSLAMNYQYKLQVLLAQLVQQERNTLQLQMSAAGFSWLAVFVQGEKERMTISPSDFSLVSSKIASRPGLVPASMKVSPPQGVQMGFSYSSYGSMWITLSGRDSNYNPSGTIYFQLGLEGTTNPCSGQCLEATHTPQVGYYHNGTAYTESGPGGPPIDSINWYYTFSFPYSPSNFQWNSESDFVQVLCSISGAHSLTAPFPLGPGGTMQMEIATTYSIPWQGAWYTCTSYDNCGPEWTPVPLYLYCTNTGTPDFIPRYVLAYVNYQENVVEAQQVTGCTRPKAGVSWTCDQPSVDTWTTNLTPPFPAYPNGPVEKLCTQHP